MLRNQAVHGAFTTAGAAGQNLVTFVAIIHRPDFSFDEPLVTAVDADPNMAFARKQIKQEMEDKLARPNKDVTGLGIANHIREETKMSERETDRAMQEIAMRAILARPLVYVRHVVENVFDIFLADASTVDETLEKHWSYTRWDVVSWREHLRRFVVPPTPEQEAAYPYLAALDSIYQPARTAGLMLVLFVVGVVLALRAAALAPDPGAGAGDARADRHPRGDGRGGAALPDVGRAADRRGRDGRAGGDRSVGRGGGTPPIRTASYFTASVSERALRTGGPTRSRSR